MRISIFGTGYVGAVTGICFADLGYHIIFTDVDESKLKIINQGKSPVYESGLQTLLEKNRQKISTTQYALEAVLQSDMSFICVGTPSNEDGSIDLQFIKEVSRTLGAAIAKKNSPHIVVVKSTVIPGTIEDVVQPLIKMESQKKANIDFFIVSNPEFLREGKAVYDFFNPDRIIIGTDDSISASIIAQLYSSLNCPKMFTSIRTAEMIKYVNNAFLATKISFANEIGNVCKKAGIDSYEIFKGIGLDSRINPQFFRSGIGFGGSCFPKDIRALIAYSKEKGIRPRILEAVLETNQDQPEKLIFLLKRHIAIKEKKIGILGLAFKPETDDIRESRAITVIHHLLAEGARIVAFDPIAMDNFRKIFPNIEYADIPDVVLQSDAILIITEWPEFENLDYDGKIVIDGRNIKNAQKNAKIYEGVCW
ncbi:MAG: UDP-glucose/GDP-mannose dehydrogenase family protein [Methanomicrobiales archaeon]|nr:UDP-glucose/GDP-mannose dehydrogenase family protein [Methanomicrobiales archaeon]